MPAYPMSIPARWWPALSLLAVGMLCIGCERPIDPLADWPLLSPDEEQSGAFDLTTSSDGATTAGASANRASQDGSPAEAGPSIDVSPQSDAPVDRDAGVDDQAWMEAKRLPWTAHYAQYSGNQRIGTSSLTVSRSSIAAAGQLRIERTDTLAGSVAGEPSSVTLTLEAIERSNGSLLSFKLHSSALGDQNAVEGLVLGESLELSLNAANEPSQRKLAYAEGVWGVMGIQAMLMRTPIKPGDKLRAETFVPGLNEIVQVELTAGTPEPTPTTGGATPTLLPIDVTMTSARGSAKSRNWIDEQGEIQKTLTRSGPQIVTFRIPIEAAERFAAEDRFAKLRNTAIVLSATPERLAQVASSSRAVYELEAEDSDPFRLFVNSPGQSVRSLGPRTVQVTVARAAEQEVDAWDNDPSSPNDLASSSFVQSSDPLIESLAVELVGAETSPVELIAALTQGVSERVLSAGLGAKPSSVEQTARRMEGDQISRAILLVGLLRNRGVPARLVSGLRVASEQPPRLVFDVWVEAWLETGWRAMDATSGREVTCGYVRMRTSSLTEPHIYQAFLPSLEAAQSVSRATLLDAETVNAEPF